MAPGTVLRNAILAARRWRDRRRRLRKQARLAWRSFAQGHEHHRR